MEARHVMTASPIAVSCREILLGIVIIVALGACSSSEPPTESEEAGAGGGTTDTSTHSSTSKDGNCLADADWFPHGNTPRPDDGTFQSVSNCVFHKWAWQMFLWLTQEESGQPRFLNMQSPQSLLGMTQRGLMPRKTKSAKPESLDEWLQAGTDGILVDHNGRSVYYSQYINPTFADFITDNGLTDPEKVRELPPETEFPIVGDKGALELKVSWMIVPEGESPDDMFTMETDIAKLVNRGGKIVVDPEQTETVLVALLGFHIAGVVNGHPEMIWATFEHKRNAPNVNPDTTTGKIVSEDDFLLYTGGTKYEDCNVNPAISNRLKLDETTQVMEPITQVCRQFEFGNDTASQDESVKTNDGNIAKLNGGVQAKLTDVWQNYFEVGAIWFLDGEKLQPGLTLADDDLLTGSLKLSNSTIETFTQTQSVMNNCFRCHNTRMEIPGSTALLPLKATNLNISHAFQNIYFWSQESSDQ